MTSEMCRTLLIETISLSDQSLYLIGKSLSQTLRVAINRVTEKPTITHLIAYLIDIETTQISRLLAIKSEEFSAECLPNISNLKRRTKHSVPKQSICQNIVNTIKDSKQSINNCEEVMTTDLTYVSGRDVEEVVDDFIFAFNAQHIDSSFLSQINIVSIKSSEDPNVVFGPTSPNLSGIPENLRPFFEIQTIDGRDNTIDGYFKVWLHDLTIDSERVRIFINSKTGQHMNSHTFVVKCDLREAIIDVNRLSIDKSGKKLNATQIEVLKSLPNIYETNSCYDLELIGFISRLGLCEAIVFGIPYILSATRSPTLEFCEMELNCQRFQSLILVLNDKNAVIVLRQRQQTNGNNGLKNMFAAMPSPDSKTLIMKSIATKELVLPNFTDLIDSIASETPPESVINSVRNQLSGLPFADIYNPLVIENNLFDIL